ncbi:MAG: hypothetical protein IJ725_05210 [Ruminococcus sp.]|nr:hypothetical protein [Ruminococcus sp.]
MKYFLSFLFAFVFLCAPITVYAENNVLDYDTSGIMDSLPDDAQSSLSDIGVTSPDINELKNLSFDKIFNEILSITAESAETPLKTLAVLIAIMLLCSLLYSFKSSAKTSAMQSVLSVCSTLCVTLAVSVPVLSVIEHSVNVIKSASDFMLAYIPAIVFIISAMGKAASGASYYGMTVFMGQCVSGVSSELIAPFLRLFLALGITSAVSPSVNLSGIIKTISKVFKWILGFVMTLFSSFLTVKQLISSGIDSVSDRAVKFSLTSFVPVAGAALSEAYKSVAGSVGLLKSGVGVLALIAVAVMFLPAVLECALWMFSIWAAGSVGELLNLSEPRALFESIGTVLSTVFAVLLSVAAVFLISTALVFMTGGSP